jgi:ankyrin repeat protein
VDAIDCRGQTPLHIAVEHGKIDCVKVLIAAHADVKVKDNEGKTILHIIAKKCLPKDNEYYYNIYTDFIIDHVKSLLNANADINAKDKNGDTPLHIAAEWHNVFCVQVLVDNGADINAENNKGDTPLNAAICYNYSKQDMLEVVKILVAAGYQGKTPLDIAKANGIGGIIRMLMQACAEKK